MKKYSKEWAEAQTREQNFTLPDRKASEADITEKQLAYLTHLLRDADESELRSLGKWQASELISQAKEAKKEFTNDMIDEATQSKGISFSSVFIIVGCIIILYVLFF